MRIAFHAPMKPPTDATPSGDRRMARLFVEALERGGAAVELAASGSSYDRGSPTRQARTESRLTGLAQGAVDAIEAGFIPRPDLWFTYHLYHKAPDHFGPLVSSALGIPYVVAEASHAPKQAGGPWDIGFRAAERAIRLADRIYTLNPVDAACLAPLVKTPSVLVDLPPFIDTRPFRRPEGERAAAREGLRRRFGLPAGVPVILAVAMMREDQKLKSYAVLAEALARVADTDWALLVVGAGPAEAAVRSLFERFGDPIRFAGRLEGDDLLDAYAGADLFAWPSVKEAFGMAFVEAAASGLAIVAGRSGGIGHIVEDGATGLVVAAGDAEAMAKGLRRLLGDPARAARMGHAGAARAARVNDIDAAARFLRDDLAALLARHREAGG